MLAAVYYEHLHDNDKCNIALCVENIVLPALHTEQKTHHKIGGGNLFIAL